jgi:hypothetical protein
VILLQICSAVAKYRSAFGPLVFVFRQWRVCECTFEAQATGIRAAGQPLVHVPRIRLFYTRTSQQAKSIDTHTNYCLEQSWAFKLMRKSETYPTRLMYTARRRHISGVRGTGTINPHTLQTGVRIAFAMVTEAVAIPMRSR